MQPRQFPQSKDTKVENPIANDLMRIETIETINKTLPRKEICITATLPTGEKQTILIPAPTTDDITWAKDRLKSNYHDRSNNLRGRSNETNIWRIFFLLEQDRLRNNAFLDIDHCTDTTSLALAAASGNNQNLILLIHYGADINKAKKDEYTPIRKALSNDRLDTIDILLSVGAKVDVDGIIQSGGYDNTKKHALKQLIEVQNRPIIKQDIGSPITTKQTSNSVWAKMDDQRIAHITEAADRFRLNKVFNFQSREIERFTESLNARGQIVHVSNPVTQEFDTVRHTEEIKAAHIELKSQGGNLEPLQHYVRITQYTQRKRRP